MARSWRIAAALVTAMAMTMAWRSTAHAQELPAGKPLRIVVINAPGGGADLAARLIADKLAERIGRPVLVDNKPGAGGNVATQFVAQQVPDGTTLLMTSNNHAINALIYRPRPYDAETDVVPVIMAARGPSGIIVNANLPAQNLRELVALSKAKPNSLSFGTGGIGNPNHIAAELLKSVTGADLTHVPYKGSAPAIADLLGGQIQTVFTSLPSAIPFIRTGKLRALAVSTPARWPGLPEVPTVAESGWPEYSYSSWLGLFAPKGTTAAVVDGLNRSIAAVLNAPDARDKLAAQGFEVVARPAAEFAAFVREDVAVSARIVRDAKIQPE